MKCGTVCNTQAGGATTAFDFMGNSAAHTQPAQNLILISQNSLGEIFDKYLRKIIQLSGILLCSDLTMEAGTMARL